MWTRLLQVEGWSRIYCIRDIKEMWEKVAIKCRKEAGQVLLKKGECAGIPQYEVLRTVSFTSLVCTAVRVQRQWRAHKPNPDSMLPRYYVASCTVNFEWLRSYRQLCSGFLEARHAQNSTAPVTLWGGLQKSPEDAPEERHPLPGCEEQLSRKHVKK